MLYRECGMDRKSNYQAFCQKAKLLGLGVMSGDDNHLRVRMGKEGHSRARFEAHARKEYMIVLYDEKDKIEKGVLRASKINIPATKFNPSYKYYSEVSPEDYDALLRFVKSRLGKMQNGSLIGINTPMKPKGIVRKNDSMIMLICGRCGKAFAKSTRCPECGQLVKET